MNPYLTQMSNIREHVSWTTKDKKAANPPAGRAGESDGSEPRRPRADPRRH
jgi:hypothetical protein